MGDLKGHILPGTFFLLYGLWWAVGSIRRYLMCRQTRAKFSSSSTFPWPCTCGKFGVLPVEGIAKIALSSVGMFGEIIFNLPHPNAGIVQHATMYFFFLMSGIVDLIIYFGLPLPPGTDYLSLALAFLVEGLLFANHLHHREELDVKIHILLVYVVFLTAVVILLEARLQRSVLLPLSRAYLLMIQGSWFWAVGIILYGHGDNKAWDLTSEMDVMQATIYFSWHCAAHFIVLITIAAVMSRCYRVDDTGPFTNGSDLLPMTLLDSRDNEDGYSMVTTHNEDSDIEYEKPSNKSSTAS